MKKLLHMLLKLIGRAKVADLDNDGKIESLNEEIQGLFSQFKIMSEKLEDTNNQLSNIVEDEAKKQEEENILLERLIEEHNRKIRESEVRAQKAQANIEKNNKVKAKVEEFTI